MPPMMPKAGTAHDTAALWLPGTAAGEVGEPDTVRGVAMTPTEAGPSPEALVAVTVKLNGTPTGRPVTSQVVSVVVVQPIVEVPP